MNVQEKQLISAFADGACTPEEKALAEQLLIDRADCRAYLAQLRKLSASLSTIKDEQLSPDAQQQILLKAKKEIPMKTDQLKHAALVLSTMLVVLLVYSNSMKGSVPRITGPSDDIGGALKSAANDIGDRYTVRDAAQLPSVRREKVGLFLANGVNSPSEAYLMQASVNNRSRETGLSVERSIVLGTSARYWGETNSDLRVMSQLQGNTEEYSTITDNKFLMASDTPLSTFSIDVDTASYSNVRRYLTNHQMPPKDAVRIEEMINYFTYSYPKPVGDEPFSITNQLAVCPWAKTHQLLHIGLKGRTPPVEQLIPSNLVFLVDVSGSMSDSDKLPLLVNGLKMMVNQLRTEDKVSIVTYAGNAGTVLEPTSGDQKEKIIRALDALTSGGSTAGGAGIRAAYQLAKDNFIAKGNNRVILATDGDFNVGISSTSELVHLIEEKRQDGIFLTVLGFGGGNLKDSRMEELADKGNGNYYYIDTIKEAKKVLVTELGSTIFTIAKDVKIQIEFNPAQVKAYRLIGYENRVMAKEDFNNDKKDAGEIGAGHTVTALYEIVPADSTETFGSTDALKYQKTQAVSSDEVMTVKLRYKAPDSDTSKLITKTINKSQTVAEPTGDLAWSSSVAEFGMLLRNSEFKGTASYEEVLKRAKANIGDDKFGLRAEFITLVEAAQTIAPNPSGAIEFKE